MPRSFNRLLFALLLTAVTGCGQMGPLYLPVDENTPAATGPAAAQPAEDTVSSAIDSENAIDNERAIDSGSEAAAEPGQPDAQEP